jgi:hypothetical protein
MGASVWTVLGWALGADPFWQDPQMTVSEAAGLANSAEAVRLITLEHKDPSRAWPVREGILGGSLNMTPLEAAVAIRREDTVRVLLNHGAVPPHDGPARTVLICNALATGVPEIVDLLLKTGDLSDPRAGCPSPSP